MVRILVVDDKSPVRHYLRAILEQSMLEVMYELPAKTNVKKCIVTKNVILKGERPVIVFADGTDAGTAGAKASGDKKAESA